MDENKHERILRLGFLNTKPCCLSLGNLSLEFGLYLLGFWFKFCTKVCQWLLYLINPELQTWSFWGSGGMQNKKILFVCRRLLTVNYLKKQKKTLLIFNLKFLDSPLHFKIYIPPLCVILSNKNFEWSLDDDSLW